jgi:hypothetical protein
MLRKIYDIFMFTAYGFLKTSLFLSLFCLSIFFFLKPKNIFHIEVKSIEPLGALVTPTGGTKRLGSTNAESMGLETDEADIFKFILRFSDRISTADAKKLAKLIDDECEIYGLDPFLILAMIYVESKFDPVAVSNKGAMGLMQVMPATGEFIAGKLGIPFNGDKSLFDPVINVRLGIYYFSSLINRFESIDQALIAYNAGPTRFLNTASLRNGKSTYLTRVLHFRSLLEDEGIITEES